MYERGAKEVLSLVTKDILTENDPSLIQVPEVIYFHMGYGKKAENKDKKLAITDEEAKFWLDYLKLSRFRDSNPAGVNEEPGEDSSQSGEEPMIIDFPTQEDTQAFDEDIVDPIDSGLQIPEKGSYIMFFSILLMFDKKRRSRHAVNVQDKKPGPNKVSDFLLFWIIPYLMNYSERKVTEIIKHNTAKGKASPLTVKKSTMDIFHAVVTMNREMSPEQKDRLEEKYRKYYGTKLLETEYTLLASEKTAPIILVPMEYQVSKTILPAIIKDLGKRESWKKIGRYSFTDEFLSRFLQNREIQKDFFDSMKDMKRRQVIDYGIILPDEKTFQELQEILVRDHADTLSHEECQSQGRHFIVPRVGLVKHLDKVYKNVIVAFSYLQGKHVFEIYPNLLCLKGHVDTTNLQLLSFFSSLFWPLRFLCFTSMVSFTGFNTDNKPIILGHRDSGLRQSKSIHSDEGLKAQKTFFEKKTSICIMLSL